jgi:hypothetical protein
MPVISAAWKVVIGGIAEGCGLRAAGKNLVRPYLKEQAKPGSGGSYLQY